MALGSRILLVDDSLLSRKIASAALVGGGFDVLEAENGQQALDVALSERPELILLDLGLPDMSGCDVARHLRTAPDMHHIPIIAVTGDADQEAFEEARQAGIDDLIVKPVDRDNLVHIITSMLEYG
jgi:CheY-like chemotaxis protein